MARTVDLPAIALAQAGRGQEAKTSNPAGVSHITVLILGYGYSRINLPRSG